MLRYIHMLLLAGLMMTWAIPTEADPFADFGVIRPKVQKPAPDFTLANLKGEQRHLSDYRGKVVLLHFWATWCLPCRTEMPVIHHLGHSNAERGLELLCINVDRGNRDGVREFMQDISLNFHTLLDPEGDVRNVYEVRGFPTTYIIGRDGKIIGRIIGERDWGGSQARLLIEHLLGSEFVQADRIQ